MHPLRNGSQATTRPAPKPIVGTAGWFTESGDNNKPSYPGQDWFNKNIAEFQNALAYLGVPFVEVNEDHLAKSFKKIKERWLNVVDFGADPTGATPSGFAFNEAKNSGAYVAIPAGIYDVSDETVDIGSGVTWFSYGGIITQQIDANKTMISALERDNFAIFGNLKIVGNATEEDLVDNVSNSEIGLRIRSCHTYHIDGLVVLSCKGKGIFCDGIVGAGSGGEGTFGERGRLSNIGVYRNIVGVELAEGNGAEYSTWGNLDGSKNREGLKIHAGNNSFIGGGMSGNKYAGVVLGQGTNDGHGRIVGMHINHNGVYNIFTDGISNGFTFSACHAYGNAVNSESGQIFMQNSKGISFEGGVIDCYITDSDLAGVGGYNKVSNVYMPGGYGSVKVKDLSGNRAKRVLVSGCYGEGSFDSMTGVSLNESSDVHVLANRGTNGGQVITLATPTGIIFDAVLKDNRLSYFNDTGIFTCPDQMDGIYTCSTIIYLLSTATIDINNTFVKVRKNGVIIKTFRPYSKALAPDLSDVSSVDVMFNIPLKAADTIQFEATVNGTGVPVIGSVDKVCELEIKKTA